MTPRRPSLSVEQLESREVPAGLSPQAADNVVTGLYHQILHRDPNAAELRRLGNELEAGVPVRRVANQVWSTPEFRGLEVTAYFGAYYGRTPTPAAKAAWVAVLDAGVPEAEVMTRFLASARFSARYTTDADYATGLYRVLFDRTPAPAEVTAATDALAAGASRADLAAAMLDSQEFHNRRIRGMFRAGLGRAATPAEVRAYAALWDAPGGTIRSVEVAFLSSAVNVRHLATGGGVPLASPLVTEYQLDYTTGAPSTHEIVEAPTRPGFFWITGQKHDALVLFDSATGGQTEYPLSVPGVAAPLGPHGMFFDDQGRFFVSLEFAALLAQVDPTTGAVLRTIDTRFVGLPGGPDPALNPSPHDFVLGADGATIWFTGKATGTVGRVNPDGSIDTFQLPTVGSVPIYLSLGPDGNIWGTELVGNAIFRVTAAGVVTEFPIPTGNSRPIVITPDPLGRPFMWFSEEAGHKVARISTTDGSFAEFAVPKPQSNSILAGLAFDRAGNLYTQSYVDPNNPVPSGPDYIIKLSSEILTAPAGDLRGVAVTNYQVPSTGTVFHRITLGSDGNMYFTELALDKVGRLVVAAGPSPFQFDFGL
ncbi:virginiamycin B lyase family protein [Gemmata sp.]|uniref:virginiamycin B lyase family protein n=1 Tax=Gemmata sp. TaxID=1914242 RepID=UPI003F6FF79B